MTRAPIALRFDFTPISFMGDTTFLVVVNPSVPVNSIAELIAYAKANPGKLNYASANTTGMVSTGLLATNNGLDMHHIPYKSEPEAMPDLSMRSPPRPGR